MFYLKSGAIALSLFTVTAFVWASESDEIREKARAMQREAAELAERGQRQEAENLERQAVAILQEASDSKRHLPNHSEAEIREMQERRGLSHRQPSRRENLEHGDSPDGIARRLDHMRISVEHLRHAGLHDIADHVAERAEATERELHKRHRHHGDDGMHEVMKQLDEIRREIGRLRNEMSELREKR